MIKAIKALFLLGLSAIGFIFLIAIVSPSSPTNSAANDHNEPAKETVVDFNKPLYTAQTIGSMVCPTSMLFDIREGHGLHEAMSANLTVFGDRVEAVEKAGCEVWRSGIPIRLSEGGRKDAIAWQTKGNCGMVDLDVGNLLVSSCNLTNESGEAETPAKPSPQETTQVPEATSQAPVTAALPQPQSVQ